MAIERIIELHPTGDGSKVQWTAYGAATDWQAVSKPDCRYPNIPDVTSGVQSSTTAQIEQFTYGTLNGLFDPGNIFVPGEAINWVRKRTYFKGAIPTNHSVSSGAILAGNNSPADTVAAGVAGWHATPKLSPFRVTTGAPLLTATDTVGDQLQLTESATQAAFTDVAQTYLEVGVSGMEHIIPSGRQLVGASTGAVFRPTYTQYANLVFDEWCFEPEIWQADVILGEMHDRGLQLVRVFLPFGYGMTSETVVNEAAWQGFERFLGLCLKHDIRLDVTGLVTFYPGTTWRPTWLDALSEANRWATFRRWWGRCAQACAGSPVVVAYDLINEPKVRNDGGIWYDSVSDLSFGTFVAVTLSGRTESDVSGQFYNTQSISPGIEKWDPKKPKGFGELATSSTWSSHGTIALPHLYLLNTAGGNGDSQSRWDLLKEGGYYHGLNKPVLVEESDAFGGQGIGAEEYDAFAYRTYAQIKRLGVPTAMNMGWKNAIETYEAQGYRNFNHRRALHSLAQADVLYVQGVGRPGVIPFDLVPVAAGNKFLAKDRVLLLVKNAGGSPITVTVVTPPDAFPGAGIADSVVSVPAGGQRMIGPFPRRFFEGTAGLAQITYSSITSLTVALIGVDKL